MFKRVARALGVDPAAARFDYAGLNHLGWLRRVLVDGSDLLPGLIADPAALLGTEEGRLFGPDWLATLGTVPNEYLWYWYYRTDAVAAEQAAGRTRGEILLEQQQEFWAAGPGAPGDAFADWEQARLQRESTYMAESREVDRRRRARAGGPRRRRLRPRRAGADARDRARRGDHAWS